MPDTTVPRGYPYPVYTDTPKDFPQAIEDLALAIDADVTTVANRITAAYARPSVRMTTGTAQSIAGGVSTAATFTGGAVPYDNGTPAIANPAANRLELTEAGVYFVSARVLMVALGSGFNYGLRVSILSSAGLIPVPVTVTRAAHATQDTAVSLSGLHYKAAGGTDFITLNVQTNASAARTLSFRNLCASKISNIVGGS